MKPNIKHPLLIILLLIIWAGIKSVNAQTTILVSGTISATTTLNPVPNKKVFVNIVDTFGTPPFVYNDSTFTDSTGHYFFTIANYPVSTLIKIYTYDCLQNEQSVYIWQAPYTANLSICQNLPPPACNAVFTHHVDSIIPYRVYFTDLSTGNPTGWLWHFGDGTSSNIQNPVHTYATHGTYTVMLIISAAGNCIDTAIGTITLTPVQTCQASFSFYPDTVSLLLIHFINQSTGNPASWTWLFGDGDSSSLKNPIHQYSSQGVYPVTLIMNGPGCSSSFTDSVLVQYNCTNTFNSSGNAFQASFSGTSVSLLPATIYRWDFGDMSPAVFGQNSTHLYASPGSYNVCLTSYSFHPASADTCLTTSCSLVSVPFNGNSSVFGQVFADTQPLDSGNVDLFIFHPQHLTYHFLQSGAILKTTVGSIPISYYYFDSLPSGRYITRAFPSPSSVYNSAFAPTFCGNHYSWSGAQAFILDSIPDSLGNSVAVNLIKNSPPTGTVSLSGNIYSGSSQNPGLPLFGIPVFLLEYGTKMAGFTTTDSSGYYLFSNLEKKLYMVWADILNMQTFPLSIYPDNSTTMMSGYNIYVNNNQITGAKPPMLTATSYCVYPNPSSGLITIHFGNQSSCDLLLEIYSITGQKIKSQRIQIVNGTDQISIELQELRPGPYFLQFSDCSGRFIRHKIIKI